MDLGDLKKQYFEQGFVIIPQVFSPSQVREVSSACDDLEKLARQFSSQGERVKVQHKDCEIAVQGTSIERISWAVGASDVLTHYGRHPKLLSIASEILGSKSITHLVSSIHYKHPGDGISFPWHQDWLRRGYGTEQWTDINGQGSYVQMFMAIDESTEENGPLLMVPESHKHRNLKKKPMLDVVANSTPVPLIMQPGDLALFGLFTIHGSEANQSTLSRRAFINGYACQGANHKEYPGAGYGVNITLDS